MSILEAPQKLKGMRAVIARRMRESLNQAAQLTFHGDANLSRLLSLRQDLKASGQTISIEDILIKCTSNTLLKNPLLNSVWLSEDTYCARESHNIGFAVAVEGGLLVPTLRGVESKSLIEISQERRELTGRAKLGKLKSVEMSDASFTVSNLGLRRVRYFTPILNAPQAAILGIGCTDERLTLSASGIVEVKTVLGLSLTVDHCLVDGDPAGKFLMDLCEEISAPSL